MAILAFQKPDKVIMLEGTETVGRFEFRPLEPGYGQTIGNALRRILLASLEGFAISQIQVSGVQDEFQTIPGVIEGMQDIILTKTGQPRVVPVDTTNFYVYVDDSDDGVINPHWVLADMIATTTQTTILDEN